MSVQAMTWALTQQAVTEPTARHVLLCLANYAGPNGDGAFPSIATLCVDTGLSSRTVQNKLRDLEEQGVISRGNQGLVRAHIRRADQRPVCYDIDLKRGAPAAPRVEHSEYSERGAANAPRAERGANDDATGCISRQNGVHLTTSRGAGAAPDPSLNHQGTVKEPKRTQQRAPGFDATAIELPVWLDPADWQRWVTHRKQIRKPLTEAAAHEQLLALGNYRTQGWKPDVVISHCINGSYQGLFAPKGTPPGAPASPPQKFNPSAYVNRGRTRRSQGHEPDCIDV